MNILDELKDAKIVGITGHVRPDGDCVGSTMGLYNFLKVNRPDLDVRIFLQKPGDEFNYIPRIDEIRQETDINLVCDAFVVLDCSSLDRIEPFAELFCNAKKTICLDHHISNKDFADVNLVEPDWSSTSEVLYTTLDEEKIDKDVATCIYTGIIHDTGVFKYSCTSKQTMAIAGKCMEKGIDYSDIIDNSFYAKTYIQNQILGRALLESVLFYDGKCIFSSISREIMDFYGVDGKSLGGIVEQLRLTEGVEVAIFMYEIGEGEYKVSLRSKKIIDVAKIAAKFDGGGHVRAAGFSIKGTVHGIINQIGALIEEQVKQLS
ncbi:DHH family phosphoesterase [Lachnospira multipara]|uniref:Phosphoesterase RecJ domain-containing protein n=1 Tax=Lachnospira multipara TaxID=28051 RepID=A0A1H5RJL7_9FIRM|nr:bifunctional oligoribonuclease/PAP phosphatase NrnA [Lachnospira multipara]SEF38552.1 phosphoesterase RecJ domain-containing protein [Lachnospira multipara]